MKVVKIIRYQFYFISIDILEGLIITDTDNDQQQYYFHIEEGFRKV